MEITKSKRIVLDLVVEPFQELNKKGKKVVVKDEAGNIRYAQHDLTGLIRLLQKIDTRLHTIDDIKTQNRLVKKMREAYLDNGENIKEFELTVDEAKFLKDYLINIHEKDAKNEKLMEFEVSTLVSVSEQL